MTHIVGNIGHYCRLKNAYSGSRDVSSRLFQKSSFKDTRTEVGL